MRNNKNQLKENNFTLRLLPNVSATLWNKEQLSNSTSFSRCVRFLNLFFRIFLNFLLYKLLSLLNFFLQCSSLFQGFTNMEL